jgi:predicted transcriptional regulator
MAKDKERRTAKLYYVEHNFTAKETAARVGVTEKTVGKWVDEGHWRAERDARNSSPAKRLNNIKEIISKLSEEWLELNREVKLMEENKADAKEIAATRSRIKNIDDAVSKWNKTLENIEKENAVPLATYISVMENIFQALLDHDRELYMQLVEFQENHIADVSEKLG